MPFLRDRLRNTRKDKNMTLEDVAEIVGVAKQTIQRYETGEIKSVDTSTVEKLANALHVTPGYLMGWTDDPNGFSSDAEINPGDDTDIIVYDNGKIYDAGKLTEKAQSDIDEILKKNGIEKYTPTHLIPILGRVAAGLPMYAEQNIDGYTYAQLPQGGKYFGLRVKGDSMTAARIFDGDIIIVREQEIVENGEIAVVAVNGDDATVKKFYRDGDIVTLSPCSFNPDHQVQIYNTQSIEIHVIGKVVLSQTVFE
jgi:repressor LexA